MSLKFLSRTCSRPPMRPVHFPHGISYPARSFQATKRGRSVREIPHLRGCIWVPLFRLVLDGNCEGATLLPCADLACSPVRPHVFLCTGEPNLRLARFQE